MNDVEIRQNFHRKILRRQHAHKDTLVIDELGLNHGKCRADIAVVNGRFVGYEIKSNNDSLRRLGEQVKSYNAVFDRVSIIVGNRYINGIQDYIPEHRPDIYSAIIVAQWSSRDIDAKTDAVQNSPSASRYSIWVFGGRTKYLWVAKDR